MYIKRKLEKLELPTLPSRRDDAVYRVSSIRYIMRCRYDQEHKLLIVAFFDRQAALNGFNRPTAVLYQGQDKSITRIQEHGNVKWKSSRILSVLDIQSSEEGVCLRVSDEKLIRRHLPEKKTYSYFPSDVKVKEGDILTRIYTYQTWVQEQKNEGRKQERSKKVDDDMAAVPKIPDAFERWLDNEPLKHSRYMVYTRLNNKVAECTCTHCRTTSLIPVSKVKHCEAGVCPSCSSAITFRAAGRSCKVRDEGYSTLLQQAKNGDFLLRYFRHSRSFYKGFDSPETNTFERGRLFFTKEGVITGAYKYGCSASLGRHGWYKCNEQIVGKNTKWEVTVAMYYKEWNTWFQPAYLYPYNMRSMLGRLDMSYSLQKEWCHLTIDPTTSILQTARYPYIRRLSDVGLIRLEQELYEGSYQLDYSKRTGSLHSCLGVPKELMPAMITHDVNVDVLNVLSRLPNPVEEDIECLQSSRELAIILDLLKYTTMHKIRKYTTAQKAYQENKKRHSSYNVPIHWRDYLQMAVAMGYDVRKKSVLFPKDVTEEHDKLVQLKQVEYDPVIDKKIQDIHPVLAQQYGFEDNNFLIFTPRNFDDFIQEGVTLLHCVCVNKYYIRHIDGSNLIFFLRKQADPETPFYTIRYNPDDNSINECEGYRHKKPDERIQAFTGKWLRFLKQNRTKNADGVKVA